jgi:putative RNA 2'-phosphotransferase
MDNAQRTKISKFLSRHLRHRPEAIGLKLRPGGWVAVDTLLRACARAKLPLTRAELDEVVAINDKQRFSYDSTGTLIRANQGHSVEVDLGLTPLEPPPVLYHGTSRSSIAAIMREGLRKMRRHHVHLSADIETALRVGARHGSPVVLVVDAAALHAAGMAFLRSINGVWLVDHIPPAYVRVLDLQRPPDDERM